MPDIAVALREEAVLPGHTLQGSVVVNLGEAKLLRSVLVVLECETFIRRPSRLSFTDDTEIQAVGRHTTFLGQEELVVGEGGLGVEAGESRLDFALEVPSSAPGSLSSQDKGRNGKLKLKYQIAYWVKAELELEGGTRKLSDRLPFRVLEPSQLSQFPAFFAFSYTKEAEQTVSSGFLRRHNGNVKVTLDFAKHYYSPGEEMHIHVQVKNQSKSTFKGVELELRRYEEVVKGGSESRDDLSWPSTVGAVALRHSLKGKIRGGDTRDLRTTLTLPPDLPLTTAPHLPRPISLRYEFTLRLARQKHVLHATELLLLPPHPT